MSFAKQSLDSGYARLRLAITAPWFALPEPMESQGRLSLLARAGFG
jgi:hypothetical protein